jgi:hypothetical protein
MFLNEKMSSESNVWYEWWTFQIAFAFYILASGVLY